MKCEILCFVLGYSLEKCMIFLIILKKDLLIEYLKDVLI